MKDQDIIELIAETLYHNDAGMTDEDYFNFEGKSRRLWKTDAPWSSQPEIELCEHERDEYRWQAEAVLIVLSKQGKKVIDKLQEISIRKALE